MTIEAIQTCAIVVGRASEIEERGAYFTHDATGVPLLVVRDMRDRVNVMLNVCRHRGTRLVETPRGVATTFVCPLHAWTYDLEGKFMSEEATLPRFRSAVRHGFVWVVPSLRVRVDLEAWLDAIDADLAPLALESRAIVSRETLSGTWDDLRARREALFLWPTSILTRDGERVVHASIDRADGDTVTWIETILTACER
jgi:phenylpropionate dioxygenase-like ring-hydroxylating dioxygenase large terminal subunit